MNIYYGDIHNHCGISYAHGDLESALKNAQLQLDFVSITGHALWPDMPLGEKRLNNVIDYHRKGFADLRKNWRQYKKLIQESNREDSFITFPSYEIHSCEEGDYVVYSCEMIEEIPEITTMGEIRKLLKSQIASGVKTFFIPHHIGYKQGYRGINWETFDEALSPFVEIISMHGCAESDDCPARPYLHTMGPVHHGNTMVDGLKKDHFFGVCGSTDHHSAHPGSYGYGRIAILSEELKREALFEAMQNRRVYALSGDRIGLDIRLNDFPMGARIENRGEREFDIGIDGGDAVDYVEIIRNGKAVKRFTFLERMDLFPENKNMKGKVFVEVGWGEQGVFQKWDFDLTVGKGRLLNIEPRLRGVDVIDPLEKNDRNYQFSFWEKLGDKGLHCRTATYGNPTSRTSATEGFCLEIEGNRETEVHFSMGNYSFTKTLGNLIQGSMTSYLGGFLTGAIRFARFVPEQEYSLNLKWSDEESHSNNDFYYLRVCQRNNQWAWSSPFKMVETSK